MEQIISTIKKYALEFSYKFAGAIVALIIGLWFIRVITNGLAKLMKARNVDDSLQPFLRSLLNIALKTLLVVSVLSMLGIEMTSFVAILGAAGLAVGMALSGTLQNFAGGVMILIFKPFKVGDVITSQGYTGTVYEIQIFNTILKTPDNKHIIIPNGGLSTSSLVNFSKETTRRVDWTFGIGYGDDIDKAKSVLQQLIDNDQRIKNDPEPFIAVSELADSSVNFTVRVWVNASDYWGVYFSMNENVYKTFGKEGLNIPYPQMDIHVSKDL
ncbi:MAG: mechanosensitive ion channel protein MscS [Flavobacteriales bacterium]|nr:mechanosensitive ion channel protein MscS [Flavobacteriales bacterium]|tara:strand:- start:7408 stop:8217 length:810 start_codon:yes stop_codon:yes gene_type:complete